MSMYDNGDMESEDYTRADFEAEMAEQDAARAAENADTENDNPIYPGYRNRYRVFLDGSYREDFHSDG